jgi:antitoxin HigA-1
MASGDETLAGASPPPLPQDDMAKKSIPAGRRKAPPPHPGESVGDILASCGVSLRTAATMMGISHNALSNLVGGRASITSDMATSLAAFMRNGSYEDSTRFWMRLQMEYDAWHAIERNRERVKAIKPCPRPQEE